MSESADYDPGPWRGYDFKTARATYDKHVGRSYGDAKVNSVDASKLIPESLTTDCESPLVIACDVTGSMGDWPAVIFSKLPYLDIEGKEYLGDDFRISFAAVGDAYSDTYPIQIQPFVTGLELEASLKKLIIEGGGGGSSQESYDLTALYYARNVEMPNAIKPIFIFIGDEGLYGMLNEDVTQRAKVGIDKRVSLEAIFEELKRKFSVYLIHKPYGDVQGNDSDNRIVNQWEKLLDAEHICSLPEAQRVVDVIFGILAKETGKVDYFRKEIGGRQTEDQIDVVMKSLMTVHIGRNPSLKKLPRQASVTKKKTTGSETKGTKSLLD